MEAIAQTVSVGGGTRMRLEKARFVLGQIAHGMIRPQKEISKAVDTVFSELDKRTWIPVTERLPEKEMLCLVSRNCTKPILLEQVEIDFWYIPKGQSLGYWLKSSSWNVTAWMPLPEPYELGDSVPKWNKLEVKV